MSRFKEQRRIDAAIAHKNTSELQWALEYCQMRLKTSGMKEHEKSWRKNIKRLEEAME